MRIYIILGFIVCFFLNCTDSSRTPPGTGHFVSDSVGNARQLQDSLDILDTIVNKTKISDNDLSVRYAKRSLVIANLLRSPDAMITAYTLCGIAYLKKAKDSSYYYYNRALKLCNDENLLHRKIRVMYNLSMFYQMVNENKTVIRLLDSVIRLAESLKDYSSMATAYNSLGNVKYDIKDFADSKKMFEIALSIAKSHDLYTQVGVSLAGLAKFETETPKIIARNKEALFYLRKGSGAEEEMAMTLVNIGWVVTNPDTALYYYKAAIKIADAGNLSEVEFGALNNMVYAYLDKGDLLNAEKCMRDIAIPMAIREDNKDWLSTLYDTYSDILERKGNFQLALEYKKNALKEKLSADSLLASDQLRLLSALLDVKSKELKIQSSEKELLIQSNQLQRVEIWLAVTLFLVVLITLGSLWFRQRLRVKMQQQQVASAKHIIEMEESEKGRTARELHDITGQLVMGIIGEIEGMDFPDNKSKEEINGKIKSLGQSIRRISHKMNRAMIEHFTFNELITGLCEDMGKLADMKVELDIPEEFPELPNEMVLHFYRIVQELLTNASKYARDGRIILNISVEGKNLRLFYSDKGPGFLYSPKEKPGMGILNIFERTKLIGGEAKLITAPGKGTTWNIGFPFDQKTTVNS